MQSMIGPTGAHQHRHVDVFEDRAFRRPILVVQRMRDLLGQEIFDQRKSAIVPALDSILGPEGNEFRLGYPSMKRKFAV
jgi:hypothetical protein